MARYTFGEALDEDDILVIQGKEYRMMPIGMRAMRKMLRTRKALVDRRASGEGEGEVTEENLDMALDILLEAVRADERDRLKEHIDESVPPALLAKIAGQIVSVMSDLDPTQPESSSPGQSPVEAGSTSTDGAEPEVSTPST